VLPTSLTQTFQLADFGGDIEKLLPWCSLTFICDCIWVLKFIKVAFICEDYINEQNV